MKQMLILSLLFLQMGIQAQSLADKELERIVSGALAEEISHCPENSIRYAGAVVMENTTGNVVANVSLFYRNAEFIKAPIGNTYYVPSGFFGAKASEDSDQIWNSRDILGYTSPMTLLQMVAWCNGVAGGKFLIRTDAGDSTIPYDSISSSEALDSLRSAMRECVTDGLGRKMNSEYVSVAGITNNSPKSVDGYKGQFAACFLPYGESKPKYTIGVYIYRKWDKGYSNPSSVARKVIDWIAFNRLDKHPYLSSTDNQSIKHRDGWRHPAAR